MLTTGTPEISASAGKARVLRYKIEQELGKLAYGASGPNAYLLASLIGSDYPSVVAVLRNMERDGTVISRVLRENRPEQWVLTQHDSTRKH